MKKLNVMFGVFLACLLLSGLSSAQVMQIDLYVSAYSPDGTQFAVSAIFPDFSGIIIYDTEGQEQNRISFNRNVDGLAWSPDGTRLAIRLNNAAEGEAPIQIFDLKSAREPLALNLDFQLRSEANDMLWSPNGVLLLSYEGGNVHFWDTSNGKYINTISTGGLNPIEDIAWHPVSQEIYILDFNDNVLVYDSVSGQQTRQPFTFDLPKERPGEPLLLVAAMAISPDGSRLALAYNDDKQTMQVLDTLTGETVLRFNAPEPDINVRVLRWTPDGREIASLGDPSRAVRFWDAATGDLTHTYNDFGIRYPRTFVFSPDGTQMVVVGAANTTTPEATAEAASARTYEMKTLVPHAGVLINLNR